MATRAEREEARIAREIEEESRYIVTVTRGHGSDRGTSERWVDDLWDAEDTFKSEITLGLPVTVSVREVGPDDHWRRRAPAGLLGRTGSRAARRRGGR